MNSILPLFAVGFFSLISFANAQSIASSEDVHPVLLKTSLVTSSDEAFDMVNNSSELNLSEKRNLYQQSGVTVLDSACTVADFETNGVNPSFVMSGSSGGSVPEVIDNPDRSSLNESARALQIVQQDETTWWCRANITFNNAVKINSKTRYMHLMVKCPSGLSVLTYEPGEHWFANVSVSKRNEWCDVVVDMMSTSYNLGNTILYSLGVCANSTTYMPDMEWYIDEITFSDNSKPRTGKTTFLDSLVCVLTTEDEDWNFVNSNPVNSIMVMNNGSQTVDFSVNIDVRTDSKAPYRLDQIPMTLSAGEKKTIKHELVNPDPGFYRYYLGVTDGNLVQTKIIRQIGYNPELIADTISTESDFDEFWNLAKADLASVAPEYKVTYKQDLGTHKIYNVEMKSIKGNTIKGYYSVPNKSGKFPAIVVSNGFGTTAAVPTRTDDYAIFSYNIRGMGLSTDFTATDDLFVNGLVDKSTYYYRDCYMDALRAVDFICSRPEVDMTKIFAEGESQGGALTYVIAALDSRILAAAPSIPFLSDFPHYYRIKENVNEIDEWPMNILNQYMKKYNLSKEDAFQNLSYFDIKNLTGKIKCPILMSVGLQDPTCPPHINFAAFNQVMSPKEYVIMKLNGHYTDAAFITYKNAWYQTILDNLSSGIPQLNTSLFKDQIQTFVNGNVVTVTCHVDKPVNIEFYHIDGILDCRKTIEYASTTVLSSGVYIMSAFDGINKDVRKVVVR